VLSILRTALLSLLVLALPLQGLAGVGMLGCHGDAGPQPLSRQGEALHLGHEGHERQELHHGHDGHGDHGAHPGAHHGAGHASADSADAPATCSVCSACCMAAAPGATPAPPAHAAQPGRRPAAVSAVPESAPRHRLERPPRPRLPA
jgi:hypothetical protein